MWPYEAWNYITNSNFDSRTLELKDGEIAGGAARAVECWVETLGRNALAEQQAMLASMVLKIPKKARKLKILLQVQGCALFVGVGY